MPVPEQILTSFFYFGDAESGRTTDCGKGKNGKSPVEKMAQH